MKRKSFLAALLILACMPGGAFAQRDDPFQMTGEDEIAMQQCYEAVRDIRTSGETADPRECIGTVSGPCLEDPDNQTTHGMVACALREQQWWDALLNFVYNALGETVNPEAKSALRDIQRAWITYKDAKCGFAEAFFEGGTMARPIAADCILRTTADRAIELSEWLDMGN